MVEINVWLRVSDIDKAECQAKHKVTGASGYGNWCSPLPRCAEGGKI